MTPDAETIPALLAAPARARRRRAGARHRRRRRSPTPSSTTRAARSPPGSSPPAWSRATGSGCCCRTASSGPSLACAALRVGAVLVPLSTLLRPPELLRPARDRVRDAPGRRAARSADRRYLDDLDAAAPGLVAAVRAGRRHRGRAVAARALWLDRRPARGDRGAAALVARAGGARPPGRRPGRPVHLGQPRRAQGRRPHPRRRAARHRGRARRPLHRRRASASTSRCRSSGRAGSAAGCSRRSSPGATLLTEAEPEPDAHARAARARAGDAVPRLARPGGPARRPPRVRRGRPVVAAATAASARCCPPSGGRRRRAGEPVRHDRVVRAVLRRPARPRPAAGRSAAAAAGRSPASRCASSIPRPAPCSPPASRARSSCAART